MVTAARAAAGPTPISFTHAGGAYVAYLTPSTYVDAVTACGNSSLLPGPGTLLHVEHIAHLLVELSVTQPDVAQGLVAGIATVTASNPRYQDYFDVWVLDRYHACRGATYIFEDENYFMTMDVPCDWTLSFLCAEESVALAQSYTVSRPWLAQHSAAAAQPSAYRLGPAGSGLRLVQSDLVVGNPSPAAAGLATAVDQSQDFWGSGPVATALFRGDGTNLMSLKLLRAQDAASGWQLYRNQSAISGYVGFNLPSIDGGPTWELWNVPFDGSDYVVSVQGCHDPRMQVERLMLVTRTGRQYLLGRGDCTAMFREDAPPGAYLAGFTGYALQDAEVLNDFQQRENTLFQNITADSYAHIYQLRMLWAVPDGAPAAPALSTTSSVPVTSGPACPAARAIAASRPEPYLVECGGANSTVCPTTQCCGDRYTAQKRPFSICGMGITPCQVGCLEGAGLCGLTPERPLLLFVRSSLNVSTTASAAAAATAAGTGQGAGGAQEAPATALYAINRNEVMTYASALRYCSDLTYLGYNWSMVGVGDAIDWVTSLDTRRGAYQAFSGVFFWTLVNASYVSMAPEYSCIRASFAVPRGPDRYTHMFYPSSCLVTSGVVCKAAAAQNVSRLGLAAAAAANRSELWVPGVHTLQVSRRLGAGPYGASCGFVVGVTPLLAGSKVAVPAANTSAAAASPPSAAQQLAYELAAPPSAFAVSMAVMAPRAVTKEEVVVGLRVLYGGGGGGMSSVPTEAGVNSSSGWRTLALAPGEVVVAVSGCAGGFVERLVFHTSAGRLWSTPFGAMSVCSAAFLEQAPQGGYLVGMQGYAGYGLEHLRLVWASPVPAPPPPPAAPPSAAPASSSGLSSGAIAGIVVGSVAGAALLLAGLAVLALYRRRQAQPAAALAGIKVSSGNIDGSSGHVADAAGHAGLGAGNPPPPSGRGPSSPKAGAAAGAAVAVEARGSAGGSSANANATNADTSGVSSSASVLLQLDGAAAAEGSAAAPGALAAGHSAGSAGGGGGANLVGSRSICSPAGISASAPGFHGGTGPGAGAARVLADAAALSAVTAAGESGGLVPHEQQPGSSSAAGGRSPSLAAPASQEGSGAPARRVVLTVTAGGQQQGARGSTTASAGMASASTSGGVASVAVGGGGSAAGAAAGAGTDSCSLLTTAASIGIGGQGVGAHMASPSPPPPAEATEAAAAAARPPSPSPAAHAHAVAGANAPASEVSPALSTDPRLELYTAMPSLLPVPPGVQLALTRAASSNAALLGPAPPASQGSARVTPGALAAAGAAGGAAAGSAAPPAAGGGGGGSRLLTSLLGSYAETGLSSALVASTASQAAGAGGHTGEATLRQSSNGGAALMQSPNARRPSERADFVTAAGNLHAANAGRAMEVVVVPQSARAPGGGGWAGAAGAGAPGGPVSAGSGGGSDDGGLASWASHAQSLVLGQNLLVDFESVLGRGASGVVHRGTLRTPDGDIPVAVKMLTILSGSNNAAAGGAPGRGGGGASPQRSGDAPASADDGVDANGRRVADEEPPEGDPDVRQHLRMLQQEVAVLSRLDHPNVVRLLGACLDPPRPFLVQELMTVPLSRVVHGRGKDGGPLYPYDLVDVLRIARDVATALVYLHPTVLHRDLKPGNVMLDAAGNAKVLDFGLARFKYATHLPTTNVEVGTTAYMSPENFSNETKITDRSDIYSWAVIVVEMATRRRPWEGTRNAIIGYLVAIERQRPQLPAEGDPLFPPGLRSLVERCMRQNPEERPSAAEIVKRLTLLLADAAGANSMGGGPACSGSGSAAGMSWGSSAAAGGAQQPRSGPQQPGSPGGSGASPAGVWKLQPRAVSQSRLLKSASGTSGVSNEPSPMPSHRHR
ncbi:hypothetical protein HXX76_015098 [Chlamydomonas incerta]|uniref:Protein kinase domain-containing protein n=1 Tax=Chlamydomonas incerta TaxID=51695 RepID=A0A835SHV0_CHLIN|nr:hypothetical protein HXX76_015098 [Chlamydomonas incerta]|eukprot:KAG2423708.1 hypothetical protein HXX76_015098 [Chlamydomonas incerta]